MLQKSLKTLLNVIFSQPDTTPEPRLCHALDSRTIQYYTRREKGNEEDDGKSTERTR